MSRRVALTLTAGLTMFVLVTAVLLVARLRAREVTPPASGQLAQAQALIRNLQTQNAALRQREVVYRQRLERAVGVLQSQAQTDDPRLATGRWEPGHRGDEEREAIDD